MGTTVLQVSGVEVAEEVQVLDSSAMKHGSMMEPPPGLPPTQQDTSSLLTCMVPGQQMVWPLIMEGGEPSEQVWWG